MNNHNEILKKVRTSTPLLIDDIRALIGQKSWSPLSRVESGKQAPTLDMVMVYHLLFQSPMSTLLVGDIQFHKRKLVKHLQQRITFLKAQYNSYELSDRINYLERQYERLKN